MQRSAVSPIAIEAIERATVAAVAPVASEDFDGWLLAFDSGAIGRAKCAVPLRHTAYPTSVVQAIEERYAARGLPAMFRIADAPALDPIRSELKRRGYEPGQPTLVQVAPTEKMRRVSAQPAAERSGKSKSTLRPHCRCTAGPASRLSGDTPTGADPDAVSFA